MQNVPWHSRNVDFLHLHSETFTPMYYTYRASYIFYWIILNVLECSIITRNVNFRRRCTTLRSSIVCWLIFQNVIWLSRNVDFRHSHREMVMAMCHTWGFLRLLLNALECFMTFSKRRLSTYVFRLSKLVRAFHYCLIPVYKWELLWICQYAFSMSKPRRKHVSTSTSIHLFYVKRSILMLWLFIYIILASSK